MLTIQKYALEDFNHTTYFHFELHILQLMQRKKLFINDFKKKYSKRKALFISAYWMKP